MQTITNLYDRLAELYTTNAAKYISTDEFAVLRDIAGMVRLEQETMTQRINELSTLLAERDAKCEEAMREVAHWHASYNNIKHELERATVRATEPEFTYAMPVVLREILGTKLEVDDTDELHALDINYEEMYDRIVHLVERDACDVWNVEREFYAEVELTVKMRVSLSANSKREAADYIETDLPISIEALRHRKNENQFEVLDVSELDVTRIEWD